jgi:hypothetical protein
MDSVYSQFQSMRQPRARCLKVATSIKEAVLVYIWAARPWGDTFDAPTWLQHNMPDDFTSTTLFLGGILILVYLFLSWYRRDPLVLSLRVLDQSILSLISSSLTQSLP